jgi:hypothetical protein
LPLGGLAAAGIASPAHSGNNVHAAGIQPLAKSNRGGDGRVR